MIYALFKILIFCLSIQVDFQVNSHPSSECNSLMSSWPFLSVFPVSVERAHMCIDGTHTYGTFYMYAQRSHTCKDSTAKAIGQMYAPSSLHQSRVNMSPVKHKASVKLQLNCVTRIWFYSTVVVIYFLPFRIWQPEHLKLEITHVPGLENT